MNTLGSALTSLTANLFFLVGHPIIIVVICALLFLAFVARKHRRKPATDDKRMFSTTEKVECKRRAGNRCEHSQFGVRCKTSSAHADHIYPWARGGATAMSNCQSLCAPHNLRKSATIPGSYYIRRLEIRRRRYFPSDVSPKVEWRLGQAS